MPFGEQEQNFPSSELPRAEGDSPPLPIELLAWSVISMTVNDDEAPSADDQQLPFLHTDVVVYLVDLLGFWVHDLQILKPGRVRNASVSLSHRERHKVNRDTRGRLSGQAQQQDILVG